MTGQPTRLLLLGLPKESTDVRARVDGADVTAADLRDVRSFLGRWKVAATPVDAAPVPSFVSADAVFLEIPTRERDEDGRVEPLALWVRPSARTDALAAAATFASSIGRSFDKADAREALSRAFRAQSRLSKEENRGFFARAVLRLLRALWRQLRPPTGTEAR